MIIVGETNTMNFGVSLVGTDVLDGPFNDLRIAMHPNLPPPMGEVAPLGDGEGFSFAHSCSSRLADKEQASKKQGLLPLLNLYKILFCRNDKTVIAVAARVNYAGVARVLILENEELMTEKVHLKYRFLYRHRLDREGLCANVEFGLLLNVLKIPVGNRERGIAKTLFKSGLVFADLTLNGFYRAVKRGLECILLGFVSEQRVHCRDGKLKTFLVSFAAEGYRRFCLAGEKLFKLRQLLLNHVLKTVANRHLSANYRNFHKISSLNENCASESYSERESLLCNFIIANSHIFVKG